MWKPVHTLLVLLAVFLLLLVISLLVPRDGWKVTDDIIIKFPQFSEVINPEDVQYANIDSIVQTHGDTADLPSIEIDTTGSDTLRADADSLRKLIHEIDFTKQGREKLYAFFGKLQRASKTKEPVRIWHYGDSQIESGRISSFVRERLQASFGGQGPGILPLVPVTQKLSWRVHPEGSWQRHTLFGKVDTTLPHKNFGPGLAIYRFAPFWNDTLPNDSNIYKASVIVKNSFQGYKHSQKFQQAVLHYGNNHRAVAMKLFDDEGNELFSDSLPVSKNQWRSMILPVKPGQKEFKMSFAGYDSPDFYALSLESANGVLMDNLPMRGSAGLIFTRINYGFYLQQLQRFNVDMIIMQFGVNVVSNERDSYSFYEKWIYNQLQVIKRMHPDIPVIVIGVSDMAKKEGSKYKSYESVAKIRNALRSATQRSGYCFWDLYEAMGGENSMPSWVFAKPSLASKDFTHFNHRGARIISNMFYNALIFEYQQYLSSGNKTSEDKQPTEDAKKQTRTSGKEE